jgi:hypothetical protein
MGAEKFVHFLLENLKGCDLAIDGRIILEWITKK